VHHVETVKAEISATVSYVSCLTPRIKPDDEGVAVDATTSKLWFRRGSSRLSDGEDAAARRSTARRPRTSHVPLRWLIKFLSISDVCLIDRSRRARTNVRTADAGQSTNDENR
jgi:hypothetical protein